MPQLHALSRIKVFMTAERKDKINKILKYIDLSVTVDSVSDCLPSLIIAVLEGLLDVELDHVDRDISTISSNFSRIKNSQSILSKLNAISSKYNFDVSEVTAMDLVDGNEDKLGKVIDALWLIYISQNVESLSFVDFDTLDSSQVPEEKRPTHDSFNSFQSPSLAKSTVIDKANKHELLPHIKSQVIQKRLIEQQTLSKSRSLKRAKRTLYDTVSQQRKAHKDVVEYDYKAEKDAFRRSLKYQPPTRSEDISQIESTSINNHSEDSEQLTQPELNLNAFIKEIKNRVPLLTEYPSKGELNRIWDKQIQTWVHALNNRLWTQKVLVQKELDRIKRLDPLDQLVFETTKLKFAENRRKQFLDQRKHKAKLEDEYRRTQGVVHRNSEVKKRTIQLKARDAVNEKNQVKGLLDNYILQQRQALTAERKVQAEARMEFEKQRKLKENADQHYLNNQIDLLKEELNSLIAEEKILERAKNEELRQLTKQQKQHIEKRISKMKESLATDWKEEYRKNAIQTLQRSSYFN